MLQTKYYNKTHNGVHAGRHAPFFVYTMSQVQICACTRIGIWQMYIIELLSEMVYKVYETGGRQSAGSAWNEAARSDI